VADDSDSAVLPGTLDLLVLQALAAGPMHGWGLCDRIRERSGDVFRVNQGSLYVALERMLARGWIVSTWRMTESHRHARFYTVTASGRRRLERERRRWERTAAAMRLSLAGGPGR
jgi:transcriptional regulator